MFIMHTNVALTVLALLSIVVCLSTVIYFLARVSFPYGVDNIEKPRFQVGEKVFVKKDYKVLPLKSYEKLAGVTLPDYLGGYVKEVFFQWDITYAVVIPSIYPEMTFYLREEMLQQPR